MSNIARIDGSFYSQQDIDDLFGCLFGASGPDKPEPITIIDSGDNIKSAVKNSKNDDEMLLYLLQLANIPKNDIQDIIDHQHRYDSFKQEIDLMLSQNKHSTDPELVEKILHIYFAHLHSTSSSLGRSEPVGIVDQLDIVEDL